MNIKKIVLTLAMIASFNSYAAGIPVMDVTTLAEIIKNAATQANQFRQQMSSMRDQIDEARNQGKFYKDMVNGHWSIEDILNNPLASNYLISDDWKSIINSVNDIAGLRDEFGLVSNNPNTQKQYDEILKTYKFKEETYKKSVERQKRITQLSQRFSQATTPSTKQDLMNSIQFEKMQMENDQHLIDSINQMQTQQITMQQQAQVQQNLKVLLKDNF